MQQSGGLGERLGGQNEHVPLLARAAVAAGIVGLFMETHIRIRPLPSSDGPNPLTHDRFGPLMKKLMAVDDLVK